MAALVYPKMFQFGRDCSSFFEKSQYFVTAKGVRPILNMRMSMHADLICALETHNSTTMIIYTKTQLRNVVRLKTKNIF